MVKITEKKFNTDFIPTISDSESDVPDLDSDDEIINEDDKIKDEELTLKKKVSKKEKKALKKSKANKKGGKKDNENENEDADVDADDKENQVSKDLNPDFVFSVEDLGSTTTFDGWDFGADTSKSNGQLVKKDVDLDDIIRRKGGLSGKVDVNTNEDDDNADEVDAELDEEQDSEEGDNNDDDELALDGFGMGAESKEDTENSKTKDSEVEEEEDDDDNEDEEDEDEDDEDEREELHFGGNSKDDELKEEGDSAEAIAKYYDEDEGTAAKEQAHKTFQSLQLSRPILKALSALNYSLPTPIQSASIPIALLGRDIVAGAVTGSGKTAAYIIPVIERLLYKPAKIAKTRVIVLTPTRELAIQVADVGRKLGQFVQNLSFGLAVGGLNLRQQEQELKKRPDIVIATPGRLIDHIRNSPSFSVDDVEIVIMDEADRMLEEGFEKEMQEIVELLPTKRQTMLFSATMNSSIKQLISWSLQKPVRIMIDPPKTSASGLIQEFVRVRKRDELKPALLYTILSKLDPKQRIIIFISTKDMCHKLRIKLGLLGLRVGELHGGLSQEQRLKSVTLFKNSTVPILLCTDLAARGLDIPKIEVVINFDMPKTHEIYLHRVGRTARAGRDGLSISFVGEAKRERAIVREVVKNVEESKKGKAFGRNADWDEIDRVDKILESKKDLIDEIVDEEKHEKEVLAAEMELKKGENMLRYKEEIESRPKRTWFMSEKEKKEDKNRVLEALGKNKKPNSKKRKREEALADAGDRSYKKTGKDRRENDVKRINKSNSKKNSKGGKKGKKKN
ncbi:nucleolar DEAD-box protein required for synthesis of 60S ribosomal subunit [Pichia californica]|uniref:ATP-dependent RNA helicase DRS1 n=1 Tax=Pichia californica TaxID=460514 RepID=A0A9P7BHD8_9ASCO|nr:nucleolar DEAD-box protein required for synthesis of 60S ribosomal subunit [[Candida] californica]KAG0689298.1 nucleolar DEAD-box protein required for synthesis of 60S ribosomal subunit [[Candida] californica]